MGGILWVVLIVLVAGWLFGFVVANLGAPVHVLLLLALTLFLYLTFSTAEAERRTSIR